MDMWKPFCKSTRRHAAQSSTIDHNLTLKQAALANDVDEALYDRVVILIKMVWPGSGESPGQEAVNSREGGVNNV